MAVNIHLDVQSPSVPGESPVKGFEGKIQVLAYSWGLSQTGTTHHGTGGGAGKVNVQDLSFTKHIDKATPVLTQACCKGTHYGKMTLTCCKAGGDPLSYLTLIMSDCIITSVSGGGSGGEDQQTENVTVNFAKFELQYQGQNAKGAKEGGPVSALFDIAANA